MTRTTDRVGYVGLGNMGGGIALHLAREGVDLTVFDLNPDAISQLVAEGAKPAASLVELAQSVDVIIVCVLNNEQVRDVVAGKDGLLQGSRPGHVIVIQSTVLPQTIYDVAEAAERSSVTIVDAPVSGNIEDRLNGTLAVIVGGSDEAFERVRPVLSIVGSPVIHVGPLGSGEVAKLANNAITFTTRNAAIEIMAMAKAYGITEDKIREVCRAGSGASWVLENWGYFDLQAREGRGADAPQVVESIEAAADRGVDLPLNRAVAELSHQTFAARLEVLGAN